MFFIIILIAAIAIFALIAFGSPGSFSRRKAKIAARNNAPMKKVVFVGTPLPGVGLRIEVPLQAAVTRLEHAMAEAELANRIKYRVLQRHSNITSAEYDWHFVELKRFFIISAVLKNTPMFSNRVDDLWHEMLLFTREYQDFCNRFIGFQLHHEPKADNSPPEDRAWFDWVYAQLFIPTAYSSHIWQGFFRSPMGREHLKDLERLDDAWVRERFFNMRAITADDEVQKTADWLIREAKRQIMEAQQAKLDALHNRQLGPVGRLNPEPITDFTAIASAMLLFSVMEPDNYKQQMVELLDAHKQATAQMGEAAISSPVFAGSSMDFNNGDEADQSIDPNGDSDASGAEENGTEAGGWSGNDSSGNDGGGSSGGSGDGGGGGSTGGSD